MQNYPIYRPAICFLAAALLLAVARTAPAQYPGAPGQGGFGLGGNQSVLGEGDRVPKMEAGFTKPAADGTAQLFIVATMPEGAHTYSITQPDGGPIRTKIKLDTTTEVPSIGKFLTATKPKITHMEDAFPGVPLEEQSGKVKWFAPIKLAAGIKPESVKLEGKVAMQLCDENGCVMPKDYKFTANYQPDVTPEKEPAPPKENGTKAIAPAAKSSTPSATSGTSASSPPTTGPQPGSNAVPPSFTASGRPQDPLTTPRAIPQRKDLKWWRFTSTSDLHDLVGGNFDIEAIRANVKKTDTHLSISQAILFGLLGGLILNIMPCVLPVIGLKILSFVQQSGHNRGKAFSLNVWYSAGLLAVFLILASLAVGPQKLGWGQLFAETWFPITLAGVVFVMALSFMGLWEVPLPAFAAGGKAGKLAAQEGPVGAFFKGALTTLLATPCSAPFLAPALVWAAAQPPWLTYVVFSSVALGMASPYLLIGAFPELLRFLPKPGPWMETFKQFMGFILMGTVVYLLTVIEPYNVIPTVGLLFALWLGCWWVGRQSPVADVWQKLRAWSFGTAFCGAVWIAMFPGYSSQSQDGFKFDGLSKIMQERWGFGDQDEVLEPPQVTGPKIVLVDFTADWCATCKQNEADVLRTEPIIDEIHRLGVVPLKADWTHKAKALEVSKMLEVLGGKQIPVIAIFSPAAPNSPTVFRGRYTQQDILDALKKASQPQQVVAVR
jgi:thiol:disulfide interchange protein DsbD